MYNLEVKEIEFDDFEKASKNKNYPESGFYLRTVKANDVEQCDLVFVDKSVSNNFCICPKSVFDGLNKLSLFPQEKEVKSSENEDFLKEIIDGFLDGTYINSSLLEKLKICQ